MSLRASWFQSTPVIANGRTVQHLAGREVHASFNPRPSSLTGELYQPLIAREIAQFQSTPVIANGRTPPKHLGIEAKKVSIHARHR